LGSTLEDFAKTKGRVRGYYLKLKNITRLRLNLKKPCSGPQGLCPKFYLFLNAKPN